MEMASEFVNERNWETHVERISIVMTMRGQMRVCLGPADKRSGGGY